jgi:hypothetical protein
VTQLLLELYLTNTITAKALVSMKTPEGLEKARNMVDLMDVVRQSLLWLVLAVTDL